MLTTIQNDHEKESASVYLKGLIELGRLPENTDCVTMETNFWKGIESAPTAKFQVIGLPVPFDENFIHKCPLS